MKKLKQYPEDHTLSKCLCRNLEVWKFPKLLYHVSKHVAFFHKLFYSPEIFFTYWGNHFEFLVSTIVETQLWWHSYDVLLSQWSCQDQTLTKGLIQQL